MRTIFLILLIISSFEIFCQTDYRLSKAQNKLLNGGYIMIGATVLSEYFHREDMSSLNEVYRENIKITSEVPQELISKKDFIKQIRECFCEKLSAIKEYSLYYKYFNYYTKKEFEKIHTPIIFKDTLQIDTINTTQYFLAPCPLCDKTGTLTCSKMYCLRCKGSGKYVYTTTSTKLDNQSRIYLTYPGAVNKFVTTYTTTTSPCLTVKDYKFRCFFCAGERYIGVEKK